MLPLSHTSACLGTCGNGFSTNRSTCHQVLLKRTSLLHYSPISHLPVRNFRVRAGVSGQRRNAPLLPFTKNWQNEPLPVASLGAKEAGLAKNPVDTVDVRTVQPEVAKSLQDAASQQQAAEVQAGREAVQLAFIELARLKSVGKMKGSPWDPLPGNPMHFSDLMQLAAEQRVEFLDYGDHGQHVAVILPHQAEPGESAEAAEVVWVKHPVDRMPSDACTEVWAQLRTQVQHVNFHSSLSLPSQTAPTLHLLLFWSLRLLLAMAAYHLISGFLQERFKPTKLENRPVYRKRSLNASMDMGLGLLGQSRARFIEAEESTGVKFSDFAGQEYVKREVEEVVRILKEAVEFEQLGVYCPKGLMLFGPPGTGKTLLAKAIAGEAGLPFFAVSGSEFVEMFAGVAASRVRDLFARARQFAPSIIFIDEIDAIGARRGGSGEGGTNSEQEQGLVQILTELDGFQTSSAKVLVIGATNRLDMIDPALLRKGRFDKTISIGRPTAEGRLAILQVHACNKPFRSEEEKLRLLKEAVELTYDFSGAELMNVMNEAAILAVRRDREFIGKEEVVEAVQRQQGEFKTGEEEEKQEGGEEARMRVSYRESAVAILECVYPQPDQPMLQTSAELDPLSCMEYEVPRHRVFSRKKDMIESIVRACAPGVVEEMVFGYTNVSWNTGAAFGAAAALAEFCILQTGMTALGSVIYESEKDLVPTVAVKVVALREEMMRYAVDKCRAVMTEHRAAMETIVERLLADDQISGAAIREIFEASPRLPSVQLINDKTWEAMDRLQEKLALENASEEEEEDGDALTEVNLFRVGDVLNQMSVKP